MKKEIDLPAVLAAHRRWLDREEGGVRADLPPNIQQPTEIDEGAEEE